MALICIAVVAYGFGQTMPERLIHAKTAQPLILWIHATLFLGWIALFFTQTLLVRTHNVRAHRRLGIAGLVVGSLIPIVGMATAIVMDHIEVASKSIHAQFIAVQISDLTCFAVLFALAGILRKHPSVHRRLMFIATCVLLAPAFARFPGIEAIQSDTLFFTAIYAGSDLLIACGIVKDLIAERSVSTVYRYSLPILIMTQAVTSTLYLMAPAWLVTFAHRVTAT